MRLKISLIAAALFMLNCVTYSQNQPQPTREDELFLQVIILKAQLAQALLNAAKCEANGSQSTQLSREAQEAGQALLKSLDSRGLMLDSSNKIIPKPEPPKPEPPKPEPPKPDAKK